MRNAYLSAALLLVLGGAVGGTSSTPAVSQGQAAVVPAPWAVEDPADSLYRAARDALNRNDYTRAADLFRKIRDTYPQSQYTPDAYYWEAFALYRRGGTTDLKTALGSMDVQEKKYPKAATRGDARSLATRISSELAKRGDPVAAAKVDSQAKTAAQGCPDPDDEDDVRIAGHVLRPGAVAAGEDHLHGQVGPQQAMGGQQRADVLDGVGPADAQDEGLAGRRRLGPRGGGHRHAVRDHADLLGDQAVLLLEPLLRGA